MYADHWSTRPDTRPPVADGWAGAEMRVFTLFHSCSPTDQPTDGRTDKASYRVACPQLKRKRKKKEEKRPEIMGGQNWSKKAKVKGEKQRAYGWNQWWKCPEAMRARTQFRTTEKKQNWRFVTILALQAEKKSGEPLWCHSNNVVASNIERHAVTLRNNITTMDRNRPFPY